MKKICTTILLLSCLLFVWTTTGAFAFEIITRDMMEKETVTETDLIPTVDNFIVLFDTSSSTNEMVPGKNISRIQAAKNTLKERNAWFPDLGYQAGLYIYTNRFKKLEPVYPLQKYDRARFGEAIDKLPEKGSGPTMMEFGLSGLRDVLSGIKGKTAIVMFTDGNVTKSNYTKRPSQTARELAREFDACFYLISSATDRDNVKLVEAVSSVNACSRVIPIQSFLNNPYFLFGGLFVVKTTAYDRLIPVTRVVGVKTDPILFGFDSKEIGSQYNANLDLLGEYLRTNPDAYVVAAGFTDSTGDEEYNLVLSRQRANDVKAYLVNTAGIDADRIVTFWFGELNPVADNASSEGRRQNRRVEIAVGGM